MSITILVKTILRCWHGLMGRGLRAPSAREHPRALCVRSMINNRRLRKGARTNKLAPDHQPPCPLWHAHTRLGHQTNVRRVPRGTRNTLTPLASDYAAVPLMARAHPLRACGVRLSHLTLMACVHSRAPGTRLPTAVSLVSRAHTRTPLASDYAAVPLMARAQPLRALGIRLCRRTTYGTCTTPPCPGHQTMPPCP